jgi:CRP/FNR family cyclic AMP-dependent transcriptional regulator
MPSRSEQALRLIRVCVLLGRHIFAYPSSRLPIKASPPSDSVCGCTRSSGFRVGRRRTEHAHAPDSRYRRFPEEARHPSARNLPGRRDRASAASTTGRLLILKEGKVAVVKEGLEIARVTEPGAVFGELSVLLDQPHTADVRALEACQFHVADAATILRIDPIALLYVATVLAQRLDSANKGLLELKRQIQAGEPRSAIGKTVEKIEVLLGATGANLMYAGYPYDPFAPDAPKS